MRQRLTYLVNSAFSARCAASASNVRVLCEESNFKIYRAKSLPSWFRFRPAKASYIPAMVSLFLGTLFDLPGHVQ